MRIAIIGCGNMGGALARRLSQDNALLLYDYHKDKVQALADKGYGQACRDIQEALASAEMIILAVKPDGLEAVASQIEGLLDPNYLIVSILVATSIATLKHSFPSVRCVRMMPNLALLYGEGVIGLSSQEDLSAQDKLQMEGLCKVLGKTYWLSEEQLESLAALAGSGPAFVFVMAEAMIDAGIAMGFSRATSQELVYQMLRGSTTLLEETHLHPGELKWQITSPQGTTIEGLRVLENAGIRGEIMNAFLATYQRGKELMNPIHT